MHQERDARFPKHNKHEISSKLTRFKYEEIDTDDE